MKTYWDHTEDERAALDEEAVRGLLKFDLMEAGVLEPTAPVMLDEEAPSMSTTNVFEIASGEDYHGGLGIAFETAEEAERFIALGAMELKNGWPVDQTYVRPKRSFKIVPREVLTEQEFLRVKVELERVAANKKANASAREEFDRASRAVRDATESVWDDWHEQRAKAEKLERVREVFETYVADCDGDEGIAKKFLVKAFDRDLCERALPAKFPTALPAEDRREPREVYVAILEGDNFDTEVFDDVDDAIHHVRGPIFEACTRYDMDGPEDEELTPAMKAAGWLYYCRSFDDGPKGRVVRKELA